MGRGPELVHNPDSRTHCSERSNSLSCTQPISQSSRPQWMSDSTGLGPGGQGQSEVQPGLLCLLLVQLQARNSGSLEWSWSPAGVVIGGLRVSGTFRPRDTAGAQQPPNNQRCAWIPIMGKPQALLSMSSGQSITKWPAKGHMASTCLPRQWVACVGFAVVLFLPCSSVGPFILHTKIMCNSVPGTCRKFQYRKVEGR